MRVLVTGATGFVGAGLLRRLDADKNFHVRAAVRRAEAPLPHGVERCLVKENATIALAGMHAVVHLAARVHQMRETALDPLAEFRRVNVADTLQLARQAAAVGVRRFVFMSSVKVNGECGRFTERDAPAPADPYGVSKCEAEDGLRKIATETGLEVTIIRAPLVYGPGVKANFNALMGAVSCGWPLPVASVCNRRSLVARDNLADFIAHGLVHPAAANETFFVSDGEDLSTPELVRRLATALNRPARLLPFPPGLLLAAATLLGKRRTVLRLLESLQVDIGKARTKLGWVPLISVEEGLRLAVGPAA